MSIRKGEIGKTLDKVGRSLQEERDYLIFLLALLAFFMYYYYLTLDFSQRQTGLLPRVVIVLGVSFVMLDIITIPFADRLKESLGDNTKSATDELLEERQDDTKYNFFALMKEAAWIMSYIIAVYYIGFFTVTFGFVILYSLSHMEKIDIRSVSVALLTSITLNAVLYYLFIHIMNSAAILRLGRFI